MKAHFHSLTADGAEQNASVTPDLLVFLIILHFNQCKIFHFMCFLCIALFYYTVIKALSINRYMKRDYRHILIYGIKLQKCYWCKCRHKIILIISFNNICKCLDSTTNKAILSLLFQYLWRALYTLCNNTMHTEKIRI